MSAVMQPATDSTIGRLRQGLDTALDHITDRLQAFADGQPVPPFSAPETSAFPAIARIFNLNETELELIALAAGFELRPSIADAVAALNGSGSLDPSTAELVLGAPIWDLLCPEAPLRHWRLIELAGSGPLRQRQIRLDERILHALLGTTYLDARLEGLLHRTLPEATPARTNADLVHSLVRAWASADRLPVILLGGADRLTKRAVAASAALELGILLFRIHARDIPADWAQRSALASLLDRELALSGAAVLIECGQEDASAAAILADQLTGPTMLSAADPPPTDRAPRLRLDLDPPDPGQRKEIWQRALGRRAARLGNELDRIAGQFALDPPAIEAALALAGDTGDEPGTLAPALWHAARVQGRRSIDGLADRIDSQANWDDLVLPAELITALHDLAVHLREAWRVNGPWGWADRSARGLGASALFAGPSGTGKTLAAEVLAGALSLDLYRIDLSQVVSKYIGETEKNLARIFTAAEDGGAILLFDEADALFGKRSEVKDSHDRYANVEVSYLLQKMEAYRGLAILTTNQKSALDSAFLRRLRYVLNFPFPDAAARARIWARIFPDKTPQEGIDPATLSRLNISGGSIHSIALNAAYLAAASPEPVRMHHIRRAVQHEYAKLEKPFTAAEKEAFR